MPKSASMNWNFFALGVAGAITHTLFGLNVIYDQMTLPHTNMRKSSIYLVAATLVFLGSCPLAIQGVIIARKKVQDIAHRNTIRNYVGMLYYEIHWY